MNRTLVTGVNLGGVLLIGFGMFGMPWVSLDGLLAFLTGPMGEQVMDLLGEYVPDTQIVLNIISAIRGPTGWQLATEIPTVTGFLKFLLFAPPLLILVALAALGIGLSAGPQAAVLPGLIQGAGGVIVAVILFLFAGSVRVLGLDPGIFGLFFSAAGVTIDLGFYLSILGLLLLGAGGFLIPQMETPNNRRSPTRRPNRR